jgi:hypothetical protein
MDFPNYPVFPDKFNSIINKQITLLNASRGKYFTAMEELAKFGTKHQNNKEILLYFNSKLSFLKTSWNETRKIFNNIIEDDTSILEGGDIWQYIRDIGILIHLFEDTTRTIKEKIENWKAEYETATKEPKKKKQKLTECKLCGAKFVGKKNLQFCKDCE